MTDMLDGWEKELEDSDQVVVARELDKCFFFFQKNMKKKCNGTQKPREPTDCCQVWFFSGLKPEIDNVLVPVSSSHIFGDWFNLSPGL